MQNFCTNCGNKLNEADKFCSSCGKESNHNNYDITCVNCGYGLAEAKVLCPNCNKSPYEIIEDNPSAKLNHSRLFDMGKFILVIFSGMIIFTVLSLLISSIPEIINPEPDAGLDEDFEKISIFDFSSNRQTTCFIGKNYQYVSMNTLSREAIKFSSSGTVNYSFKSGNQVFSRFGNWKHNGNNIIVTWKTDYGSSENQTINIPNCEGMYIGGNYFVVTD